MVKYTIEGGINFYEELYKSFGEPDAIVTDDICKITGMPLIDRFITLECNHKFNYNALYKEIYKQKFIFRTYNSDSLISSELIKLKDAKKDYFIKCPYCRCIQFTLLPYYEDMGHEQRYGVNSLDKIQSDYNYLINSNPCTYSYTSYGYTFNSGACCKVINNIDGIDVCCKAKMSSPILEMNKSFCYEHIRGEVKKYKSEKLLQQRESIKNEKIKQKDDLKNAKIKQKEDLRLLKEEEKALKKNNKKVQNVVIEQGQIQTYNPDSEIEIIDNGLDTNGESLCQAILKSGAKKGQVCGNKIQKDNFCLRHCK